MALKALSIVREEFRKTREFALRGAGCIELTDLERRITDRFYRECLGQTEPRPPPEAQMKYNDVFLDREFPARTRRRNEELEE